jgi:hypothetical protein
MGGFLCIRSDSSSPFPLTASQIAKCWKDIKPFQLPEKEIKDKSKADFFAKAVALMQISFLSLSIIIRAARHLAFSQLELLTLAFAICGIFTYVFSWYKPKGVEIVTRVRLESELSDAGQRSFDSFWDILTNTKRKSNERHFTRIPNDNVPQANLQSTHQILYVLAVFTAAFGGIHVIAWNFEFPTPLEKLLWRTASLISVGLPPLVLDFDLRACTAGWSAIQGLSRGSETPKLKCGFQRYRGYLGGFGNPEAQSFELYRGRVFAFCRLIFCST